MQNGQEPKPIKIAIPSDGLEQMTVDELIGIQEGNLLTIKLVLGRFVVASEENGNIEYLTPEEGAVHVGKMTVAQLREASGQIGQAFEDFVPKE